MKTTIKNLKNRLMLLIVLLMNTTLALAQDGADGGGASVTVSKTTTSSTSSSMPQDWYTQPWVWIVGALVFILLLVALVRGGSSRTTDVHRTTIRKDVSTE